MNKRRVTTPSQPPPATVESRVSEGLAENEDSEVTSVQPTIRSDKRRRRRSFEDNLTPTDLEVEMDKICKDTFEGLKKVLDERPDNMLDKSIEGMEKLREAMRIRDLERKDRLIEMLQQLPSSSSYKKVTKKK